MPPGLFPKKLAVEANKGNMNNLDSKKSSEKHRKDLELAHAKEQAEKIKNITLSISNNIYYLILLPIRKMFIPLHHKV